LLAAGELLELFTELEPLVYHDEQERAKLDHPLAGKALLIARKPKVTHHQNSRNIDGVA